MPFIAERKMEGSIWRQGCWLGSITSAEEMAYFRKAGVLLMTVWRLRSTGFPRAWIKTNNNDSTYIVSETPKFSTL